MDKEAIAKGSKGADGRQVWGKFAEMIARSVKAVRSLPCNSVIFAGVSEKSFDGIDKRAPDVYGKSAERFLSWYDEVFYMFIDNKKQIKFLTKASDRSLACDTSGRLEEVEDGNLLNVHKKLVG